MSLGLSLQEAHHQNSLLQTIYNELAISNDEILGIPLQYVEHEEARPRPRPRGPDMSTPFKPHQDDHFFDLNKSTPFPTPYLLATWNLTLPSRLPPPLESPRQCKKPRTDQESNSLRFRNHVSTYKQKFSALEAVQDLLEGETIVDESGGSTDGTRLVQLLISCAEAVACRDRAQASVLLSELKSSALVLGSSFQRVASCFVQGLSNRLALLQPLGAGGIVVGPKIAVASDQKVEALRLAYEVSPFIRFGHFVANAAILEAFEGESLIHVVDLGMTLGLPHGLQWRNLIDSLTDRVHRIRITGVGTNATELHVIGDELEAYAESVGVRLEFFAIESNLENLRACDFVLEEGEVLAVSSMLQLHCVVKESRGALNSVLQMIHELSPKVLVLVEQDSSHNGPFFLGRFMEALHYYSAIFDSLDTALPKYDTKRAKVEQFYFAEEIKNIVSCEGPARVERHERVDQWRRRMSRAGFQSLPIKMMSQAKKWLVSENSCDGYTLSEEKGCLVLGWKSKPIIAASCWKC